MADRVWCRLTVGGSITAEQMEQLDDLVRQELAPDDAGQDTNGAHWWIADEVAWGSLPDRLEEVLKANDLTYKWENDGKYEIPAGIKWWQPGLAEPCWVSVASDYGDPVIRVESVRDVLGRHDLAGLEVLLVASTPVEVPRLEVRA